MAGLTGRNGAEGVDHGTEKPPSADRRARPRVFDPEAGRCVGDGGLTHCGDTVDVGRRESRVRDGLTGRFQGEFESRDAGLSTDPRDPYPRNDGTLFDYVAHASELYS